MIQDKNRPALLIDDLSISVGKKQIIKDICLHVQEGLFMGLLGPNGCGKSTLLKAVYQAIRPQGGTISLFSQDVLSMRRKELAKQLSAVTQFNEIDFDFSVKQMVMIGRTPHKKMIDRDTTEDYEIADKAIAAVGLSGFADRSFSTLSGGEKQRVVLARAIAQEPQFMILDEPTNHLDIKYQLQIISVVKNLNISILAPMHDLTLAAECCDYIYLMKNGEIIAHGLPQEVITESNVEKVYDVRCRIYPNPVNGKLAITYLLD